MNLSLSLLDLAALSPLLIVLAGALIVLGIESFSENVSKKISFPVAFLSVIAAITAAIYAPGTDQPLLTPWLKFDPLAKIFTLLFLGIGAGTMLLATSFFQQFKTSQGEFYFLLLSALFGLILIGASADFLTLFLGLETLSISLYVLCGYMKKWEISHEGSMKYFLIGALAAAFLLYGIALVYGAVGTTRFDALLDSYRSISTPSNQVLFMCGVALVTLGLTFKAAVVPFHFWAPDVYDGAPTPVTAFMAVGTKAGAFAALVRVFMEGLPKFSDLWSQGIIFLAYPTLIYANFVAIKQQQLRRFFAYSGISHAGYLLIPLAAGTPNALSALVFYLIVYAFATLGAFSVLAFLDKTANGVLIKDLHGLFYKSPWLAGILTVCLLTLAGIPPTAGFFAKFYIFKTAFEAGYYAVVIVGLLMTVFAAYYYLRIIAVMFTEAPEKDEKIRSLWPAHLMAAISLAAIVALSLYPAPIMDMMDKK